jgi:hypothetical protein
MKVLTIEQIRILYPDQWVLISNPELSEPTVNASIVSKLVRGTVLFASKDKRELAYKASELRQPTDFTVCVFTGTFVNHYKQNIILNKVNCRGRS